MNNKELTHWSFDKAHSRVGFRVKHLMITNVDGKFREYDGEVTTKGDDFSDATVKFTLKASSIDTEMADRDTHLKSADFFDATNYPEIKFESTGVKKMSDEKYEMAGNLKIRDVSKKVVFQVEDGGVMKDPWGNIKAGFTLSGKINRKDWGLNWNAALEAGGVLVGEEVKISSDIELVKS